MPFFPALPAHNPDNPNPPAYLLTIGPPIADRRSQPFPSYWAFVGPNYRDTVLGAAAARRFGLKGLDGDIYIAIRAHKQKNAREGHEYAYVRMWAHIDHTMPRNYIQLGTRHLRSNKFTWFPYVNRAGLSFWVVQGEPGKCRPFTVPTLHNTMRPQP